MAAGDCVLILFYESYLLESVTSTSTAIGGKDEFRMGSGDDIAIGGQNDDLIYGDDQRDILLGDSAEILFYTSELTRPGDPFDPGHFWSVPHSINTVGCEYSGDDIIYGGNGAVDYLVGGGEDDTIYGEGGPDLAFGDHANILLYEWDPYRLAFATTADANCTGGSDSIILGEGNDIAFGGAKGKCVGRCCNACYLVENELHSCLFVPLVGDYIQGNQGQDVILGMCTISLIEMPVAPPAQEKAASNVISFLNVR